MNPVVTKHNGNGAARQVSHQPGKTAPAEMAVDDPRVQESLVSFQTAEGLELQGIPLRVTRHLVVFELYNPAATLQFSEVLSGLRIVLQDRMIYSGRAVVRSMVNAGSKVLCEATLNEADWLHTDFGLLSRGHDHLGAEFSAFLGEWQKFYKVLPDYKIIVADMQTFFAGLRLWLEEVELGIRSTPSGSRQQLEQEVTCELARVIIPVINELFEKFERVAEGIEPDQKPAHASYMRQHLHPLVLGAPFAHRTFYKPLGYAGDYEMVNMIARDGQEGGSLFAKIVNCWFLKQAPAVAHRNRLTYLADCMKTETLRVSRKADKARIFNFACGPAVEMQRFLGDSLLSEGVELTLSDFNRETLDYLRQAFGAVKRQTGRNITVEIQKKAVHQLLKESLKPTVAGNGGRTEYDFIYCAGLFDYLSDNTCKLLMEIFYDRVAPGGLLVATNVDPSNPLRHGMAYLLDWHLVYRTPDSLRRLKPSRAPDDAVGIRSDTTGVNLFLEVRKPDHG